VSPSTQLEHLIYYIDMLDAEKGESIQELIDKNLVAEFEQRCCQNDIKCLSQINDLPEYAHVYLEKKVPLVLTKYLLFQDITDWSQEVYTRTLENSDVSGNLN
jgi:hypothetical protein